MTHENKEHPAALKERSASTEHELRGSAELAPYRQTEHRELPPPTTDLERAFAALTSELRGAQRVNEIQRLVRACYVELLRPGPGEVSFARLQDTIEALEVFETKVMHEVLTMAEWGVISAAFLGVGAALYAKLPEPYGVIALFVGCLAAGWAARKAREAARIHFCAQRVGVLSGAIFNAKDRLAIRT